MTINIPDKPRTFEEAGHWLASLNGSIFYSGNNACVEVVHDGEIIHKEHPIGKGHGPTGAAMMAARKAYRRIYFGTDTDEDGNPTDEHGLRRLT